MSHARTLSKMKNEDDIVKLANRIVEQNLNVREIEEITQNKDVEKKHKVIKNRDDNKYYYLETSMSDKLGTKVKFKNKKIEISFSNDKDLERILEILKIKDE